MIDPHALRTLIEQWREFSTKPIGVNCAAGYDGITATLGKCADELEAVLSALPETPWQPIATAPKDGRMLLLSANGSVVHGYYGMYHRWIGCDPDDFTFSSPTHWMPLPAPPPPSE